MGVCVSRIGLLYPVYCLASPIYKSPGAPQSQVRYKCEGYTPMGEDQGVKHQNSPRDAGKNNVHLLAVC